MTPDPWFEVVGASVPVTQGDMITDGPLLTWDAKAISADAGRNHGSFGHGRTIVAHSVNPAAFASSWNILTVSSE